IAMTLFTIGTVVCVLAPGFLPLLAGRIVQACGTAIMMPLLMTTVMNLVPPSKHGRVMGNISIVIAVAPALVHTDAGAMLSFAAWPVFFDVVLPIAVFALGFGLWRIEIVHEASPQRADAPSVVLSVVGFGPLAYGLTVIGGDSLAAATGSSGP